MVPSVHIQPEWEWYKDI